MKFLCKRKDGGRESTVTGYWLVEIKPLFSICLLRFDGKSREAFHTHAFNCISWVIAGRLRETFLDGRRRYHIPALRPFITRRSDFHKVDSVSRVRDDSCARRRLGPTWVFTIRGPWCREWREFLPKSQEFITLTNGRRVVPNK